MATQEVKDLARKLDPGCWESYSGMPKSHKQAMDHRRTAALALAEKSAPHVLPPISADEAILFALSLDDPWGTRDYLTAFSVGDWKTVREMMDPAHG